MPWFEVPGRQQKNTPIIFGHWSTLRITPEKMTQYNVYPVDTGNVWGGELTAMRLEDRAFFSVQGTQSVPIE